jgi:hypothetical protein
MIEPHPRSLASSARAGRRIRTLPRICGMQPNSSSTLGSEHSGRRSTLDRRRNRRVLGLERRSCSLPGCPFPPRPTSSEPARSSLAIWSRRTRRCERRSAPRRCQRMCLHPRFKRGVHRRAVNDARVSVVDRCDRDADPLESVGSRRWRSLASAEGGTRTPTGYRPLHPECSASTSSTTSAREPKRIGASGERQRRAERALQHFARAVGGPILGSDE